MRPAGIKAVPATFTFATSDRFYGIWSNPRPAMGLDFQSCVNGRLRRMLASDTIRLVAAPHVASFGVVRLARSHRCCQWAVPV